MGQLRFLAPRRERVPEQAVEQAYLAGMDGIPWRSRGSWQGDQILVEWSSSESGNLYIPWRVEAFGELTLSTASLMDREEIYHLPLELARGTLARLRNQAAEWELEGLKPPESYFEQVQEAMQWFVRSATSQADPVAAADHAEHSLQHSLRALGDLGQAYCAHELEQRRRQEAALPTFLAGDAANLPRDEDLAALFVNVFNWAAAALIWREIEPHDGQQQWEAADRQIEWCREQGLQICSGPLMRLDQAWLPDWLRRDCRSFDALQVRVFEHVEDVVRRYQGAVRLWHTSSGMNARRVISLTEEQRLRLAVTAIESAHQHDAGTPILISFDQPWCEYMAREQAELSPLDFADALVRAELGVTHLGLEVNFGYWPDGTLPRDALEIGRQLDRWGNLGLPLIVLLTIPSSGDADPRARHPSRPVGGQRSNGPTPETQRAAAELWLRLLLAKPFVQGVVWRQLSDAQPHEFAHGGLFDDKGRPKPAAEVFQTIRRDYLA